MCACVYFLESFGITAYVSIVHLHRWFNGYQWYLNIGRIMNSATRSTYWDAWECGFSSGAMECLQAPCYIENVSQKESVHLTSCKRPVQGTVCAPLRSNWLRTLLEKILQNPCALLSKVNFLNNNFFGLFHISTSLFIERCVDIFWTIFNSFPNALSEHCHFWSLFNCERTARIARCQTVAATR